jgi:predicted TIM-barrel fold metal-dependent hydrolase
MYRREFLKQGALAAFSLSSFRSATFGQRTPRQQSGAQKRLPIIDMQVSANSISEFPFTKPICTGEQNLVFPGIDPTKPFELSDVIRCRSPIPAAQTEEKRMTESLEMMRRYNIRRAVTSGDLLDKWYEFAPDKIIRALSFSSRERSPDDYRKLYKERRFSVFAEVGIQYRGYRPDDPLYEPYFALAEELEIPVGVHFGEGPPGGVHILGPTSKYHAGLGSPFMLEEVLLRHRKLRIYVCHYGSPLVDEMIAMLFSHPNLYVNISCNNWLNPRKQFYDHLRKLVEAGFEKRIMYGSDQMAWPAVIGKAVESTENAPFLNASQKRDILYNNAARFLRLSKEDIARDHA